MKSYTSTTTRTRTRPRVEQSMKRKNERDSANSPYSGRGKDIRNVARTPLAPSAVQDPQNGAQGFFDSAQDVNVEGGVFNNAASGSIILNINQHQIPSTIVRHRTTNTQHQEVNGDSARQVGEPDVPCQSRAPTYLAFEKSDQQIYCEQLLFKGRGTPLFVPSPNSRLPKAYRHAGVSIGDVGTLNELGAFSFLFNIFEDTDGKINRGNVPHGFRPLRWAKNAEQGRITGGVNEDDIEEYTAYSDESWVGSQKIKRDVNPSIGGYRFEAQASEGAILAMPQGASSKDLVNRQALRDYMASNLEEWYKYANLKRGREAKNGDIRLVYGCDKASSWGIGTFRNDEEVEDTILHFTPVGSERCITRGQPKTYVWSCTSGGGGRAGPTERELRDLIPTRDPHAMEVENDSASDPDAPIENQCLFVRTFNAMLSDDVWNKVMMGMKVPEEGSQDNEEPSGPSHKHGGRGADSASDSDSTSGGNHPGVQFMALLGESESSAHPSSLLNRFLLKRHPHAKVAITEDADWMAAYHAWIQNHDPDSDFELIDTVSQSFKAIEEEGVIFLKAPVGAGPEHKTKLDRRQSLKRHPQFYLKDGDIRIIVGNTLFKIHRKHLDRSTGTWDFLEQKQDPAVLRNMSAITFASYLKRQYQLGNDCQSSTVVVAQGRGSVRPLIKPGSLSPKLAKENETSQLTQAGTRFHRRGRYTPHALAAGSSRSTTLFFSM